MKVRLTLQEKLRDLRDERKLTLQNVADSTGIPVPTLQRIESNDDVRASYQDIAALAEFYEVSTDYLFGITDNRQYRNITIDALSLSDNAIEVLKSKKLNNFLISKLLSHDDFQKLLNAIEVYIDTKRLKDMNEKKALLKLAETFIKEKFTVEEDDKIIEFLQNAAVDEDEFLRFRISERFNSMMKSMFVAHKKDGLTPEQNKVIEETKDLVQVYLENRETETENKAKAIVLCQQLGLNAAKLDDEEWRVLMKVLESSPKSKQIKQGGGRKRR